MKYALGNMLNGAGGLNADQLALDLQFAADKSLAARKGPTPTFTRASSGTFVGSNGLIQSAGNNVARFDHDPVTLESRGLLIEESRTNQSLYSGALVFGTGWGGSATSASSGTGPDGNTAYQIAETTATQAHSFGNTGGSGSAGATSVVSGTIHTSSIFLKKIAGSVDWVQLTLGAGGFGSTQYANFNIGSGTVGNSAGLASGTSPRIEAYPNGWYRCSISVAASATTSTSLNLIIGFVQNTNATTRLPSYAGSTSNQVLASLCQFEVGSFATSYIQTFGSSVVRSADVCSISGAAFTGLWEGEATVLFSGMRYQALATTASRSWALHAGSLATEIYATKFGTQELLGFAGNNVLATGTIIPAFQQFKTAHAIKTTNYAGSQNGLATITSNNAASITPNVFNIGSNFSNGGLLNGTISAIRYYRKRLANAKLQALTA